jgi:ferredoxin
VRIVVDPDTCFLSGECVYNHPTLFAFGSDAHPSVLVAELTTEAERRSARQAAEVCPSGAISLVE